MADVKKYETDIAIIGSGGAGMAAGIEARDAGASAIAFEKATDLFASTLLHRRIRVLRQYHRPKD